MTKEEVMKWLQECSGECSGESCDECPCVNCDDCAGELMKEAVKVLTEK